MLSSESNRKQPCRAVVLAAGKGTRMKSEHPKVLMPLAGRPMLLHVLDSLVRAGITDLTIVIGYKKEEVIETIDGSGLYRDLDLQFVDQNEQLGTAHAVLCTEKALGEFHGPLMITNGDMPMLQPATFARLLAAHQERGYQATVLSARVEQPTGYGRLVRDDAGELLRIVEEKDADEAQRKINEINSGTYIFESPEIFSIIRRIGHNNAQNEYYLPDVIALLRSEGGATGAVQLDDPLECLGANSLEDLELLENNFKIRT